MNKELLKRAVVLFPRTEYVDPAAVRHARRKWLICVAYLHASGRWSQDGYPRLKVERLQ
jgi:hypothetical protein